ncbi:MAG: hypothetical protein HPY53_17005 [Brevinematales bacterium]|nr:hypothetical protein [Brevinematales bacterium]
MKKGFLYLFVLMLVFQASGFSDMIVMKAGQNIVGKIIDEDGSQYIVVTKDGTIGIDKSIVETVIKDAPDSIKLDYDKYVHSFINLSLVPPIQTDLISVGKPHINNLQIGLIASFSEIVWGAAWSPVVVTTEEFKGFSMGLFHYAGGYAAGVQFNLLANVVGGKFEGWQFAPVNIVTGYASAFQMGGINYSTKFSGFQLGGINIGNNVAGVQIGLVNFAVESYHLPIGLLNISRKGTLAIEVWYDSLGMANFTFKSGVKNFYYIYNLAYGTLNNVGEWGAGLGVRVTVDPIHINLEGSMNLMSYNTITFDILHSVNMMFRLYTGYPITKFLRITGGFTYNRIVIPPIDPLININSIFGPVTLDAFFTYRAATVFGFFIGVEIDFARLMD